MRPDELPDNLLDHQYTRCALYLSHMSFVEHALEPGHIDESLHAEREDVLVAEQRAELHAKLSAMLYGIAATPAAVAPDSAVDAVMARVQAYREIKNQIQLARDAEPR